MYKPPVAVMCFDRLDYFKRVIEALEKNEIDGRKIFLFHDLPVDAERNTGYRDVAIFCENLVAESPERFFYIKNNVNLGFAAQWYRMMTFMLDVCGCPAGYIFEDDLVISSDYLESMDRLYEMFKSDERIGIYSCFNPQSRSDHFGYSMMGHDWGICVPKNTWDKIKNLYFKYIKIQSLRDYRARDHRVIKSWVESLGLVWRDGYEGADSIFEYLLAANGMARLATNVNLALPIGEQGMHFTKEIFSSLFSDVTLGSAVEFRYPTDHEIMGATEKHLLSSELAFRNAEQNIRDNCFEVSFASSCVFAEFSIFNDFYMEIEPQSPYIGKKNENEAGVIGGDDILFGPYVRINPGRYFVCIHVEYGALSAQLASHFHGYNFLPIASTEFALPENRRTLLFEFIVGKNLHDAEIVVTSPDKAKIRKIVVYGHCS